jgi:hypothetical protein
MEHVVDNSALSPPITYNLHRRLSVKDWEDQRATVQQLYSTENKTLQEVIEIMEKEYGFHATYITFPRLSVVCRVTNVDLEQGSTKRGSNVGA